MMVHESSEQVAPITCVAVLSEKQKNLLSTVMTWPGPFPMHVSELRSGEHVTLESLKRLSLVSGRCILRATDKGRAALKYAEGRT